ncbi:hypothetical protein AB0O34_05285 [Sphaerisporangium sp. NPDC088356]|uniref:hypothetical protein n=1 Tax=Sphaerisporangium sp. NPDC088356 TaxID=3154871 RepID=UPI00341B8B77
MSGLLRGNRLLAVIRRNSYDDVTDLAAGAYAVSLGSDLTGSAAHPLDTSEITRRAVELRRDVDALAF